MQPFIENTAVETAKTAQGIINKSCLIKCPSGSPVTNIIVDHEAIILSSNKETKFADWVAYLSKAEYLDGPSHDRNWAKDPNVEAEYTLIPEDYRGLHQQFNLDRGHQAPLGSFKSHPKWYVVNYFSNVTLQKGDLDHGSWNNLEIAQRNLVKRYGDAYVFTGPYYNDTDVIEGPSFKRLDYTTPSGYWKLIAIRRDYEIQAVSFSFP